MDMVGSKLCDYIGDSLDVVDILARLRKAALLRPESADSDVQTLIEERIIALRASMRSMEQDPSLRRPLGENRVNHLLPFDLQAHLNARGLAWRETRADGSHWKALTGPVLEADAILRHLRTLGVLKQGIADAAALETIRQALEDATSDAAKSLGPHYDAYTSVAGWLQALLRHYAMLPAAPFIRVTLPAIETSAPNASLGVPIYDPPMVSKQGSLLKRRLMLVIGFLHSRGL